MFELIYTDNYDDYKKIKELIAKDFLNAKIEDASDSIHTHRFSVELDIESDKWYEYLLKSGFPLNSLNFQIKMRREPDELKEIIEKVNFEGFP